MEMEKKQKVINICLDYFVKQGFYETSTRGLSRALKLQNSGLYYYFKNKDEAVILCAQEASIRVEKALIEPTIHDMADPDNMMKRLRLRADEMAPTMRFLSAVNSCDRYKEQIGPVVEGMLKRYDEYTGQIAERLSCDKEEVRPYVYMTIAAVMNYMIFGSVDFVMPQIQVVKDKIRSLIQKEEKCDE